MRFRVTVFCALAVVCCCGAGFQYFDWLIRNRDNPNRPDAVGVFIANGIFDASDPDYVPPTGEDFDRIIMGRDDQKIAERKQLAIDFFLKRFGVDFNDSDFAQNGNVILTQSYTDPRWNYRCYTLPGRVIPRHGLIVHDGQWVMFVAGENATFYGTWGGQNGTQVPFGTAAVDGEYLIQGTQRFRQGHRRNVYIKFNSTSPIFGAATGDIKFNCAIESSRSGEGAAIGRQELHSLGGSMIQVSIQNVLQYPAPLWTEP